MGILRVSGSRTSMPPSEMSAVCPRTSISRYIEFDRELAGQPFVLAAIAHFRQAQEDHAARFEALGQARHGLARMIDAFAVRRCVDRCLFDLACAIRDGADETGIVAGVV